MAREPRASRSMSEELVATKVEAPEIPLPRELRADVVVLPRQLGSDGRALYHDSVVTFVKEFADLDVSASFADEPDARGWVGEKALGALAVNLIVGIASSGGWDALCYVFGHRFKKAPVRVRAGRFKQTAAGTSFEWYEAEGPGEQVAKALAAIPWELTGDPHVEVTQLGQASEAKEDS